MSKSPVYYPSFDVYEISQAGKPWTTEAVADLLNMHRKGYNIYHISNIIKRSPQAIREQLKKLGHKPVYK